MSKTKRRQTSLPIAATPSEAVDWAIRECEAGTPAYVIQGELRRWRMSAPDRDAGGTDG